jgi:phosphatidylserine/phosphatidylglycerophosphate/cardiolipin synthase-like enzyme
VTKKRAVLHAKAVVIDGRFTLLTSANFTEAAQQRNIEAGVLINDPRLAKRISCQFDLFVEKGILRRVSQSASRRQRKPSLVDTKE